MLTHLPLGDSGTRLQDTHCTGHHDVSKISLLVSWTWVSQCRPWALLLTEREHERRWISPDVKCISLRFQIINTPAKSKKQRQPANTVQAIQYKPSWPGGPNMAIRLITGRFQQWSSACKNNLRKKPDIWGDPASFVFVARLRVALLGGIGWLKPSWREVKSSKHHDVLGSEYLGVLCRYLREEGELACLCLVSALVIQPVLLCSVLRRFVHVTGCGKHLS